MSHVAPEHVHTAITSLDVSVSCVAVHVIGLVANQLVASTREATRCVRGWDRERAMSTSSACFGASLGSSRDVPGPIGSVRGPITATWSSFTLGCMAVRPGTNTCQDPRRKHHVFGFCLGARLDPSRCRTDR